MPVFGMAMQDLQARNMHKYALIAKELRAIEAQLGQVEKTQVSATKKLENLRDIQESLTGLTEKHANELTDYAKKIGDLTARIKKSKTALLLIQQEEDKKVAVQMQKLENAAPSAVDGQPVEEVYEVVQLDPAFQNQQPHWFTRNWRVFVAVATVAALGAWWFFKRK